MELVVPFEQVLLRQALQKHVHRLDQRKGIAQHIDRNVAQQLDKKRQDQEGHVAAGKKGVAPENGRNSFDATNSYKRHSTRRGSAEQLSGERKQSLTSRKPPSKEMASANHGFLELQAPAWRSGTARCRISRCINLGDEANEDDLKLFLHEYCRWKPVNHIGVGNMDLPPVTERPMWEECRPATADTATKRPGRKLSGLEPPRSAPGGPHRRLYQGRGLKNDMLYSLEKMANTGEKEEVDDDDWDFLRHFPLKVLPAEEPGKRKTVKPDAMLEKSPQMKILYSDLKALLRHKAEEKKSEFADLAEAGVSQQSVKDDPSAVIAAELADVPTVTVNRWMRLLTDLRNEKKVDTLPELIAHALADDPKHFTVVPTTEVTGPDHEEDEEHYVLDGQAIVQVAEPLGGTVASAPGRRSIAEDQSHGGRKAREERFVGLLKAISNLSQLAAWVSHEYDFSVDVHRFALVSSALDRSESLRLCGGLMSAGDRLQLNNFFRGTASNDNVTTSAMLHETVKQRPVRRGKDGLTADWLLATMNENSDDENLEEGDSMRLLTEVIADAGRPGDSSMRKAATRGSSVKDNKTEHGALTEESWLLVCSTLGLFRVVAKKRRASLAASIVHTTQAMRGRRRSSAISFSFNPSPQQSPPPKESPETSSPQASSLEDEDEEDDAVHAELMSPRTYRRTSVELVREAKLELIEREGEARQVFNDVQQFHLRQTSFDSSLEPVFAPLVLETLLQKTVFDITGDISGGDIVPGGAGALTASLLWEYLGWDSPIGRRLIRRLSVVFLFYSTDGTMNKSTWMKFCREAGLLSPHEKGNRFVQVFTQVCMERHREIAQLTDFILAIETVASWKAGPRDESALPLRDLPGDARNWAFLESFVLRVTGTRIKATAPEKVVKAGAAVRSQSKGSNLSGEASPEHHSKHSDSQGVADSAGLPCNLPGDSSDPGQDGKDLDNSARELSVVT